MPPTTTKTPSQCRPNADPTPTQYHPNIRDEIVDCLSLIIASVPVALPMVIQITMALGAANMAEQKVNLTLTLTLTSQF